MSETQRPEGHADKECRGAFDNAGYWPNEVMWKAWQQAWAESRVALSAGEETWQQRALRMRKGLYEVLGAQHVLKYIIGYIRRWRDDPNFKLTPELERVEKFIGEWHVRLVEAVHPGWKAVMEPRDYCGVSFKHEPHERCDGSPCPTHPEWEIYEPPSAREARELERLRERVAEVEEAEGRCCPEDVGFEEYIGVLERRVGERDVTIANQIAAINAMNLTPREPVSREWTCNRCGGSGFIHMTDGLGKESRMPCGCVTKNATDSMLAIYTKKDGK